MFVSYQPGGFFTFSTYVHADNTRENVVYMSPEPFTSVRGMFFVHPECYTNLM